MPKSQAELTAWDSFSNSIPHNKLIGSGNTQGAGSTTASKGGASTTQPTHQQAQPNLPVAKPQFQGVIIDKQQISVHKKVRHFILDVGLFCPLVFFCFSFFFGQVYALTVSFSAVPLFRVDWITF